MNTETASDQLEPAVASNASGDFVVAWMSYQDADQSGVFAQRYNASGVPQGAEFQVNSYTTAEQDFPAVAIDAAGNFVVAWESRNQDGSGFGIYAQRYDAAGAAQGSEFRVNMYTAGHQYQPSVAMAGGGSFVVSWFSENQDGSGFGVYAQRYDAAGVAQGGEFQVNTYTASSQGSAAAAMDAAGNFVIAWASFGQDGSDFGVYAQRYDAAGIAQDGEFRANTYTTGSQHSPSAAMDAAGNFVVAWESVGQDGSGSGVYAQRYDGAGVAQGVEFRVNSDTSDNQSFPSVAMGAAGEFIVAWESGDDLNGDEGGIYAQRYTAGGATVGGQFQVNTTTPSFQFRPSVAMDGAGNFVATWQSDWQDGSGWGIYALMSLRPPASEFRVNTYTTGEQRVPAVASDPAGNFIVTWESSGQDGSGFGIYAQRYDATGMVLGPEFQVNSFTFGDQLFSNVAKDATGNFVVTWASSSNQDGSGSGIYAQRYDAVGVAQGSEFLVNSHTLLTQEAPAVATDAVGNFVVAWQSSGQDGSGYGIYAQRYDAAGVAQGGEFLVNTYTVAGQQLPSAAMDAAGNFVVAWHSENQDGSGFGVYAQRYDAGGVAQGGEFRVNTYTTDDQSAASVAMDAAGNFVVAWQSTLQDGSSFGIHAQRYNAAGIAQGPEFQVNSYTLLQQQRPSVAVDAGGNFVVTWESNEQDGDGYGIYARRYNAAGVAQGPEFPVNSYTTSSQAWPAVAMDAWGNFVVTWHSQGQDGSGNGVYTAFSARPQADPGGPYSVSEGSSLVLDGSSSVAPDDFTIVSYQWDIDYDGVTFNVDAVGAMVPFDAPEGPLTKTVALRVSDEAQRVHIAATTVTVNNAPPQIVSLPDYSAMLGEPIFFSAVAVDPSASDVVTFEWDFGDGTIESGVNLSGPVHAYTSEGEFFGVLIVYDQQGASSYEEFRVVVGPPVEFVFAGQTVDEGAGQVTIDAQFAAVASQDIVIPLALSGTAADGADYSFPAGTLTIPAGLSTGSATVTIADDVLDEAIETVIVTMGVPSTQASVGANSAHTISITDNDPLPQVSFATSSSIVNEDVGAILLTARLLQVSGREVTVPLVLSGSAGASTDYTPPAGGVIVIPAGQTTASVTLSVIDDALPEGAELIIVQMQPSSTAELSTVSGDPLEQTVIIRQNDEPNVSLTAAYRAVPEDLGTLQITLALSTASTLDISVPFTLAGTAAEGSDYTVSVAGEINIPAGMTEAVIDVTLTADGLEEDEETIELVLGAPTNAVLGSTGSFVAKVLDADSRRVSFGAASLKVWEDVGSVTFDVTLTTPAPADIVVPISILTTAGLEESEFLVSSADIVIPAGLVSVSRVIQIFDDSLREDEREALQIRLNPPANLKLGDHPRFTLDVLDDDPEVQFAGFRGGGSFGLGFGQISDNKDIREDGGNLPITVSLSAATNSDVQVPFAFAGTAEAGVDFTASPASVLVIPAGAKSGVINLSIVDDLFPEGKKSKYSFGSKRGESFSISLGTPIDAARGARDELKITITDNDVQPMLELSTSEQTVSEGTKKATIEAQLTVAIGVPVTVELILDGGSAALNSDFKMGSTTIVIPAGSVSGSVDVTIIDDKTLEGNETIVLRTGTVTNAAIEANWIGSTSRTHTITIADNDKKPAEKAKSGKDPLPGQLQIDPNPPKKKLKIPKVGSSSGGTPGTLAIDPATFSAKGSLSIHDGYLQGSRVFFDANFNGTRDFLDLDDNGIQDEDEPSEPEALTEFDGMVYVEFDVAFDRNADGLLDLSEGQWVAVAGEDTSTQLPSGVKFVAPIGVFVLNPVSTVLAALMREHGFDLDQAEARVWEAFDLPPVDLRTLNVLEEAADGDGEAAALFALNAQIQDAVVPIAHLLSGAVGAPPFEILSDLVFADIAGKIVAPDSALDLANTAVVASVIGGVLATSGLSLDPATVDGAAQIIAEANQRIVDIPNTADADFVEQVARVQTVAQGTIGPQLADVAAGLLDINTVIQNNTGAALDDQIALAAIGNVVMPLLAINDVEELEGDSGQRMVVFTVSLVDNSSLPVSVEYSTLDFTATSADGDYTPTSGTFTWQPGDNSPRTILVEVFGDAAFEPDEAFLVVLDNSLNAAIRRQIGYGYLVNDEPLVFDAPTDTAANGMHLRVDGSNASLIVNDEVIFSGTFFHPQPITIVGAANLENSLVIEVISPSSLLGGGLTFQGGALDDSIVVLDETAGATIHTLTLVDGGNYDVDGALITYSGVEFTEDVLTAEITGIPSSAVVGAIVSLGSELPLEDEGVTTLYAWEVTRGGNVVGSGSAATLDFIPDQAGDYVISLSITTEGRGLGTDLVTLTANDPLSSTLTGRRLFYNNSIWDDPGFGFTNASAIAGDKTAYIPNGANTSTFANISSYSKGINGIMVELTGTHGTITADDFTIRMSGQLLAANNAPGTWMMAPAFTVTLVPDTPTSGTDRYELVWADGAITNRYVYVVVEGDDSLGGFNTNTGLAASDYFFFGNMIGDAGSPEFYANVDATDQVQVRLNQGAVAPPTGVLNLYDFNRDALIDATDQIIARSNQGAMPWLALTAPPSAPEAAASAAEISAVAGDDGSGSAIASALAARSKSPDAAMEALADVLYADESDDAPAQASAERHLKMPAKWMPAIVGGSRPDDAADAAVDLALEELFADEELLESLVG